MGLSSENARNYLSGLLIGAEVSNFFETSNPTAVHLFANPDLADLYEKALKARGVQVQRHQESSTLKVFLRIIADFEDSI